MAHNKMLSFGSGGSKPKPGPLPFYSQDVEACMTTSVEVGGNRPTERKSSRSWSLPDQIFAVLGNKKQPHDAAKKSDEYDATTPPTTPTTGRSRPRRLFRLVRGLLVLLLVAIAVRRFLIPAGEALAAVDWCERFPSLEPTGVCAVLAMAAPASDAPPDAESLVPEALGPQQSLATLLVSLRTDARAFPHDLLRSAHGLSGLAIDVQAADDPATPLAHELAAFEADVSRATEPLRTLVSRVQDAGRAVLAADEAMSLRLGGIAHAAGAADRTWWWVDAGELARFANVLHPYSTPRRRAMLQVVDEHVDLLNTNMASIDEALHAAGQALGWLDTLGQDAERIGTLLNTDVEKKLLSDLTTHRATATEFVHRIKTELDRIRADLDDLRAGAAEPREALRRLPVVQGLIERSLIGWNELLHREVRLLGSSLESERGDKR